MEYRSKQNSQERKAQMVEKHLKTFATFLVIMEHQFKTTSSYIGQNDQDP